MQTIYEGLWKEIMLKTCIKCNLEKDISEFELRNDTGKLRNACIVCSKLQRKQYRMDNSDKIIEKVTAWQKENPDKVIINNKKWAQNNKDKVNAKSKRWKDNNKDHILEYNNEVYHSKKSDPVFMLKRNLRIRLSVALKNNYKSGSAIKDLGCPIEDFKIYLEKQFYFNQESNEMMSWDNYGVKGWHIDHIIPLASFDLADREQFKEACHYTNLQPLWAKDNLSKGAKIIGDEK